MVCYFAIIENKYYKLDENWELVRKTDFTGMTDEEKQDYMAAVGWEEWYTGATRFKRSDVEALLQKTAYTKIKVKL